MSFTALQFFKGWSIGYQFLYAKTQEDALKQGENYYIAAVFQTLQATLLIPTLSALKSFYSTRQILSPTTACQPLFFLGLFPFFFLCALAKQAPDFIPKRLRNLMEKNLRPFAFLAEHSGDFLRVAIITSSIALIYIGNPFYGSAILASQIYGIIDEKGWVPYRISLYMEQHMPIISAIGLFLDPSIFNITLGTWTFLCSYTPFVTQFIQRKIDHYMQKSTPSICSLEECESPWIEKKDLSYEEAVQVLQSDEQQFTINTAHCTKSATDHLPKDFRFYKLLELFDQNIYNNPAWQNDPKNRILRNKLYDDDRFLAFLSEQCNIPKEQFAPPPREIKMETSQERAARIQLIETKLRELAENTTANQLLDHLKQHGNLYYLLHMLRQPLIKLIEKVVRTSHQETTPSSTKKLTSQQYVLQWTREQLHLAIQRLSLERRGAGDQSDLEEAIDKYAKILHYLVSNSCTLVDREDFLLKIAVEGGNYCNLGLVRAADEMVFSLPNHSETTPTMAYEERIRANLERLRSKIFQASYEKYRHKIFPVRASKASALFEQNATDTHLETLYKDRFAMGFTPLSSNARRRFNLRSLLFWETLGHEIREEFLFPEYQKQIREAPGPLTETTSGMDFDGYIRSLIDELPYRPEQKVDLIHRYEEVAIRNKNMTPWFNLLLVMLGVFKYPSTIPHEVQEAASEENDDVEVDPQVFLAQARVADATRVAFLQEEARKQRAEAASE